MDQYSPKKTLSTSTQESFEALGECFNQENIFHKISIDLLCLARQNFILKFYLIAFARSSRS